MRRFLPNTVETRPAGRDKPVTRPRSVLTVSLVLLGVAIVSSVGVRPISATDPADAPVTTSPAPAPGPVPAPSPAPSPSTGDFTVPEDVRKGYYVHVSLAEQKVTVYLDGAPVRTMAASTGTKDYPTPTGRFHIQNRDQFFFSEKYKEGGKWWVSFKDWGIYLFHSVPTDRDGKVIPEEAAKLGQPASHGCVRLSVEDARWFYDTIPEGAPVDID